MFEAVQHAWQALASTPHLLTLLVAGFDSLARLLMAWRRVGKLGRPLRLAGWLLAASWYRMDAEVLLFFAGNLAWMTATAGLLYLEAPAQLCVSYLQDDQQHAGLGLVVLAVAAGGLALRQMMRSGEEAGAEGLIGH